MAGLCELRIELSEPTKSGEFVGTLSDTPFFRKNLNLLS